MSRKHIGTGNNYGSILLQTWLLLCLFCVSQAFLLNETYHGDINSSVSIEPMNVTSPPSMLYIPSENSTDPTEHPTLPPTDPIGTQVQTNETTASNNSTTGAQEYEYITDDDGNESEGGDLDDTGTDNEGLDDDDDVEEGFDDNEGLDDDDDVEEGVDDDDNSEDDFEEVTGDGAADEGTEEDETGFELDDDDGNNDENGDSKDNAQVEGETPNSDSAFSMFIGLVVVVLVLYLLNRYCIKLCGSSHVGGKHSLLNSDENQRISELAEFDISSHDRIHRSDSLY